jgi:hypothetical protein
MAKVFSKSKYYKKVGYRPHHGQRQFHNSRARFRVAPNGRRFGKTMMGSYEVEPAAFTVSKSINGGPQLGWICGPQYSDTEKEFKIVYDDFRKVGIDKEAIKFQNNSDNGSLHIVTSWGFELVGKSAKHPESLVGDGLDFVLMVEAGRHKRNTWGQYIRPTLSDKKGWAAFTGVPEGKSENSLLYALWARGNDPHFPNWESWRFPSWANNIIFPGGREDPEILEAEADLTEDEFNRQYGALFVDKVGAVMQEWDDEVHLCNQDYNPDWPLYLGIDYGFTNPFVVLFIQVDEWGNVYVIKERRFTQVDAWEVVRELKAEFGMPTSKFNILDKIVRMYPDPASPEDTFTLSNGLKIPAVKNTGGELRTRLSLIRRALKQKPGHLPDGHPEKLPTLRVNRSCTQLSWEMREGYRWPEHKSEIKSDSENPLDKDNHGPEALGRFFRGYFGIPSETQTKQRTRVSKGRMG